jgi:hypothetical protein
VEWKAGWHCPGVYLVQARQWNRFGNYYWLTVNQLPTKGFLFVLVSQLIVVELKPAIQGNEPRAKSGWV